MTDVPADTETTKRFRSPPYPMFDLGKAVERLKNLYAKALHHQVGVGVLAEAWGMKSGDGKVWRAAAAMIQYGLLTDSGTGKTRKFQIADAAKRIVLDTSPDSEKRAEVLKTAALSPMIHRELWQHFHSTTGLADSVIRNYLTLDRGDNGEAAYSPSAADEVLKTYRATLAYAGLSDSDSVAPSAAVMDDNGADVSGPDDEVKKVPPDVAVKVVMAPVPSIAASHSTSVPQAAKPGKLSNVSTSVIGNRLQISADVDAEEINALVDVLKKYQEILKLMH